MVSTVENFLFGLMSSYDDYVYTPLQRYLSPKVKLVPRYINLSNERKVPVFTANIVTLARTFLILPIAWFLKYDYCFMAGLMVALHDFLDHVDGIVAKVHKQTHPGLDDPLLGGFLDAFCDKVVNVFSLWTIIQMTPFHEDFSDFSMIIFLLVCYLVIGYEVIIGIVRVDDYYEAKYKNMFKQSSGSFSQSESSENSEMNSQRITQASMEGKLKEKLESMGIAFLCLGLNTLTNRIFNDIFVFFGLICLALTLRMAHKSLTLKLNARKLRNSN